LKKERTSANNSTRNKKDHNWKKARDPNPGSAIQAPSKNSKPNSNENLHENTLALQTDITQANTEERAKRMRRNEEEESYL
jgi:hypothetical protein